MITIQILINGEVIYARTATNRIKEHGHYILDTGERVIHEPEDGVIPLAIKMLHTIYEDPDELFLCENCFCMTKTWHGTCGKCRATKAVQ